MIELIQEDLRKYTTVKIGGITELMLIPENTQELLEIVKTRSPKYFFGGGSNLLINDRLFDCVVNLRSFNTSIVNHGDGLYKVGASVRLQKIISKINEDGYGGIEYLCNVPGLVGGAIAMNAGTGKREGKSISDYVISVDVIENKSLITKKKEECHFEFRNSYFRNNPNCIVTSIVFRFPPMKQSDTTKAKNEKMSYYQNKQDPSFPNFGSVFKQSNHKIMRFAKIFRIGSRVHFSGKTENWIINEKQGDFKDAITAIKIVEIIHRIFSKKCSREVIVWE